MINNKAKFILCHTPFCWYKPASIINLAIRKITNSYFDHAITVFFILDKCMVDEALGKGCYPKSLKKYLDRINGRKRKHFVIIGVDDLYVDSMIKTWGRAYAYSTYYRLPLFLISRKIFGLNSKITKFFSKDGDGDKSVCFERMSRLANLKNPHLITGHELERKFKFKEISLKNLFTNRKF